MARTGSSARGTDNTGGPSRLIQVVRFGVPILLLAYTVVLQQANLRLQAENRILAESSVSGKTSEKLAVLGGENQVEWTVPEDILNIRLKECSEGKKTTSTGGYCLGNSRYLGLDASLADAIAEHVVKGGSVVDLGAGLGWYGKALLAHKTHPIAAYSGYDGALNVEEKSGGLVKHMDLTQPSPIDRRPCGSQADWVLSLEVAEHIPPQYTDSFLRNVRCRARIGTILSWAATSQRRDIHVNTKDMDDAIKEVERWGFKVDMEATKVLQEAAKFGHFKRTAVVYRVQNSQAVHSVV